MNELDTTSEARAERAFAVWAGEGERSDEKTAELTGIPRRTVAYYRRRDGWAERYVEAHEADSRQVARLARLEMRHALPAVVRRLSLIAGGVKPVRDKADALVYDAAGNVVLEPWSRDQDAIKAGEVLLRYVCGVPERAEPGLSLSLEVDARQQALVIPEPRTEEETHAAAVRILEANYEESQTRGKRGAGS